MWLVVGLCGCGCVIVCDVVHLLGWLRLCVVVSVVACLIGCVCVVVVGVVVVVV